MKKKFTIHRDGNVTYHDGFGWVRQPLGMVAVDRAALAGMSKKQAERIRKSY
jgi:hypothetical protein